MKRQSAIGFALLVLGLGGSCLGAGDQKAVVDSRRSIVRRQVRPAVEQPGDRHSRRSHRRGGAGRKRKDSLPVRRKSI